MQYVEVAGSWHSSWPSFSLSRRTEYSATEPASSASRLRLNPARKLKFRQRVTWLLYEGDSRASGKLSRSPCQTNMIERKFMAGTKYNNQTDGKTGEKTLFILDIFKFFLSKVANSSRQTQANFNM
ncbi:hypothetical protein OI18_22000 [Flavihumibacter solisilvae]|uniref:Uncharacterized protein n=1 Tax=Flavihumibacter solisilvae TaxID=1349421 RepID=A0A0C1INN7_9BACT|nr:hypothetical protein OI18_22000 [Flavihumibacter solisilvae]